MILELTGFACTCKHYSLEPSREVIHDREVACRHKEVADSNQNGNLLLKEEGCEDRFGSNVDLDDDEKNGEDDGSGEGRPDCI